MIARVTSGPVGGPPEMVFALHRVGDRWVVITENPDSGEAQAVERCLDDVCDLLEGLAGLILVNTAGLGELRGHGSKGPELLVSLLQGLEMAIEGLQRRSDEPEESDIVELPEGWRHLPEGLQQVRDRSEGREEG